jgi:phosphatidylcholine synthase
MRTFAFLVHVFTACGGVLALLALVAAVRSEWALMFLWLGAALIVDGFDGVLARALSVKERVPRWSGDVLDLVVDFITYVFVPAYAIAASGLLSGPWAIAAGAAIVITGALYFADTRMKSDDNHFIGFPAVWNLIAFYLLLLRPEPWATLLAVAAFAVLTFLPMRFVHPFRVRTWRPLTVALLVLWSGLALAAVLHQLAPPLWTTAGLCLIGIYFLLAGLLPPRQTAPID